MRPLVPVSTTTKVLLGVGFFVVFFAAWTAATLGGYVNPTFLADPLTMAVAGWRLLSVHGFARDIGVTVWRVFGGFALAAVVGVPLGIAMGAWKPIEAFFEPFISFARYLPASGFIPLLILWAGIGEAEKLLVIFIGSFFQVVLMVAVTVGSTRRDLVEAAYTLGARASGIVGRVLLPSSAPTIAETLRLGMDLRHRRGADRLLQRHRPHDHRQPGAARHGPDHLRHRGHRRHRPRVRLSVQDGEPAAVSLEPRLSGPACHDSSSTR